MKLFPALYIFFVASISLAAQIVNKTTDEKVLLFTNIHSHELQFLKFRNNTHATVDNLQVHVDCGCVKIQNCTKLLDSGQEGSISLTLKSPSAVGRKFNTLFIAGTNNFVQKIKLATYFFSEIPQVFGDTITQFSQISSTSVSKNIIILGDNNLAKIKFILEKNPSLFYELSPLIPIEGGNGCFKRILKVTVDPEKLLLRGKRLLRVHVDNDNEVVASTE